MSNSISNFRIRPLGPLCLVTSTVKVVGASLGQWSLHVRFLPGAVEARWVATPRSAGEGGSRRSRIWRTIASSIGLARLSHCVDVAPRVRGLALRLPRLNATLTWQSIRSARRERAHDVTSCAACEEETTYWDGDDRTEDGNEAAT